MFLPFTVWINCLVIKNVFKIHSIQHQIYQFFSWSLEHLFSHKVVRSFFETKYQRFSGKRKIVCCFNSYQSQLSNKKFLFDSQMNDWKKLKPLKSLLPITSHLIISNSRIRPGGTRFWLFHQKSLYFWLPSPPSLIFRFSAGSYIWW